MTNMLGGKVLYVDDQAINIFVFKKMFDGDFPLICAGSGAEALEVIERVPEIRLVFTDMNMPNMNGLEFIKKAKLNRADIEFVIVTGESPSEAMNQAVMDGLITECIYRPFGKHQILSIVSSLA